MKRWLTVVLLLLFCMGFASAEGDAPVRIMAVSDLHYLASDLYAESEIFLSAISRGDGKATMYSRELLDGLLEEVRHQQPDLLVISGDLTFNGERKSHEELAASLAVLVNEGIPVAVIPGNHDINNTSAVHYLKYGYEPADAVSAEDFRNIWQGFTASEISGQGISGVVKLRDNVWVVMGDYSVYEYGVAPFGLATTQHLYWLDQVTKAAGEEDARLISVSHQGLVPHMAFAAGSYIVNDGDKVLNRLAEAGCLVNLSGHMHLQHILRAQNITDIATGAWSMSPHRYGIVTVDPDGSVAYDAYTLCPEHAETGLTDNTRRFFRTVTMDKLRANLAELGLAEDVQESMLDFAASVNEAYFGGTVSEHPELREHPGRAYWLNEGASTGFGAYLSSILEENTDNDLHWRSDESAE